MLTASKKFADSLVSYRRIIATTTAPSECRDESAFAISGRSVTMVSPLTKFPPPRPQFRHSDSAGQRGGGGAVRESHEQLFGEVVQLLSGMGVGYVKEASSGRIFGASRRYLGEKVWRLLKEGARVRFSDSGHRTIKDVAVIG